MAHFHYDSVVAAVQLLAASAIALRDADYADPPLEHLDEVTATCLRLIDDLLHEDIVGDGLLTGPALQVAQLDGWTMPYGLTRICACADDPLQRYETHAAARAHVAARAASGEPGTKLHQIALSLSEEPRASVRSEP